MAALAIAILRPCIGLAAGRHWQRNPQDPRWVQGQLDVAAAAPDVWQRATHVEGWCTIFSDIASFSVRSRSRDGMRWVVSFASRIVGHGVHDFGVTLDGNTCSGHVVVNAPGVMAAVYASVAPLDARRSRVTYSVFADRSGFLGLFIPEAALRSDEERVIEQVARDLERTFGTPAP